jgi:uncharacterized GH25 family protein
MTSFPRLPAFVIGCWHAAFLVATATGAALLPDQAAAHEFWIAPNQAVVAPGSIVSLELKVGEMMLGSDYPYLSSKFRSFTVTTPKSTRAADGIEGDVPAYSYKASTPGLHIAALQTLPLPVTFETLDAFRDYLAYEGLAAVLEEHARRGLPQSDISEHYIRCAKALVQVGAPIAGDVDRPIGLPIELVVDGNPYSGENREITVQLLWQGNPLANRQISVFRHDGTVTRALATTDDAGQAKVDVSRGGRFLLNAVHIDADGSGESMWRSHWASLTFELPLKALQD